MCKVTAASMEIMEVEKVRVTKLAKVMVQAAALQVWADQLPVSVERRRMALMGTQAPLEVLAATAALVATVEMAVQAATAVPANRQPQA